MTLDPNTLIRKQDCNVVISGISRNPIGRYMVWNWLRNDWDKISKYFNTGISSGVSRFILYASRDFNTPFELKEIKDFYELHKNELGTAKRSTLNSIENVKANVEWMNNYYQTIYDWLSDNVGSDFSA